MQTDYFESSTISTILSWIFAIPIFIGLILWTLQTLFDKFEGLPRIYLIWLFICIMFFSPFRYLVLQIILATSYGVQSWSAFFSMFLLVLYIPIVFGILYAVGFGLPLLANFWVTGLMRNKGVTKLRLFISAILTPFICVLGTYIFLWVLPYAGYATHWLKAENVIRASNGPAWIYYEYVGSHFMPIETPGYTEKVGTDLKTFYRNHIASIYLSERQHMRFIKHAYPDFYNSLPDNVEAKQTEK